MDIRKSKEVVRITNINQHEFFALLKCDFKMKVITRNPLDKQEIDFIYLLDRTKSKKIIVSRNKSRAISKNKYKITYSEAIDLINKLYINSVRTIETLSNKISSNLLTYNNIIEIVITKDLYTIKKPLIDIISNINEKLAGSLVSIDFNYNVYILKFKDNKNSRFINSFYYWPATQDYYAFDSEKVNFGYKEAFENQGIEIPFKNILDVVKFLNSNVS